MRSLGASAQREGWYRATSGPPATLIRRRQGAAVRAGRTPLQRQITSIMAGDAGGRADRAILPPRRFEDVPTVASCSCRRPIGPDPGSLFVIVLAYVLSALARQRVSSIDRSRGVGEADALPDKTGTPTTNTRLSRRSAAGARRQRLSGARQHRCWRGCAQPDDGRHRRRLAATVLRADERSAIHRPKWSDRLADADLAGVYALPTRC
jgi:hypothetical protein